MTDQTAPIPSRRRRAPLVAGAVLGLVALAVAAILILGGRGEESSEPPPVTSTSTTALAPGVTAPLTGLPLTDAAALERPAIAVKIDNLDLGEGSRTAVPQSGPVEADIVIEEMVEANITRLVAIFHSTDPGDRVGPVRSARTSDLDILPQFGRILFAWSGGNDGVTAAVAEVPVIVDSGIGRSPDAYRRDPERRAPHNLYVDAGSLWGRAPDETTPPGPLFGYRGEDDVDPPTWEPAVGLDIVWGPGSASSPVGWAWNAEEERYEREQRGRAHVDETGTVITAGNVVVLETAYGTSAADTRSPEAETVGEGEALVLTNGGVIRGRWIRPEADQPAELVDETGEPILLVPGPTWIELPRPGSVTIR